MQHRIKAQPSDQSDPNVLALTALQQRLGRKSAISDQNKRPVRLPSPDFDHQILDPSHQAPMRLAQALAHLGR
jgi:hypothetical protein